jgi:cell division protein FtsA
MGGAKLSVDMLALHGSRNRLRNTIKVVQNVPMNVEDVVFSGLCSSLAVLTPEQKEIGALVIDLGGGTTDYVAYCGKILATAGALGVGGDHVTNDIALAFNISIKQAERLKREFGSATVEPSVRSRRVELEPEIGFPDRSVSLPALHTVINARMDEILTTIRSRLQDYDITHQIGAGSILTGGGARLSNTEKLAQRVFGLPCTIGRPGDVDGLASATGSPEYATPVGMVRYGFMMGERDAGFSITDWLKGLIGRSK